MTDRGLLDFFARRAAEYDRVYTKPERQADLAELKSILSTLFKGLDVLEIACGTGYWTQYLARSANSITATDFNEETLEVARGRDYTGQVKFEKADAYYLKAVEGHFNGGFAGFWLSHVPRKRYTEMFTSLHSCLSDGALMVWLDNRFVEGSSTPLSRRDAEGNTYQIRILESGDQYEVLKNFPTPDELLAVFGPRVENLEIRFFQYYWLLRYIVKKQ